ncbi:MAG: hypothetical protein OXI87_24180 [Albidovulum sp.]|nr:hypothetical protein [Albidovulum sp.]
MFGSGNRGERVFENSNVFDVLRDNGPAIPSGAGPHFFVGAWASRRLVEEVDLPALFSRLRDFRLRKDRETIFGGRAFRGPLSVQVEWGD